MTKPLNARQKLLIKEYLVDLNQEAAALRAGYTPKTARHKNHELFANPHVKAAIEHEMAKRAKRIDITADKVLTELAKIGFANMSDYIQIKDGSPIVDMSKMDRDKAAAIAEVTSEVYVDKDEATVKKTKFKLADKRAALVDIGRHLGMFVDRSEVAVSGGSLTINKTTKPNE